MRHRVAKCKEVRMMGHMGRRTALAGIDHSNLIFCIDLKMIESVVPL